MLRGSEPESTRICGVFPTVSAEARSASRTPDNSLRPLAFALYEEGRWTCPGADDTRGQAHDGWLLHDQPLPKWSAGPRRQRWFCGRAWCP
jgi:hypothetical protein